MLKRLILATLLFSWMTGVATARPDYWAREWPETDFSKTTIEWSEILDGGPPKDGIPAIDKPVFRLLSETTDIADTEPVIGITVNGETRAYPIRILMWHEIVNDTIGGIPVSVTFCPLCNAAIVFDRRVDGRVLDFGTTGKLRMSDLVMYDRQTESWWQQFLGQAIVGELTGTKLKMIPSRLESFARFRARATATARVLVPNSPSFRRYGKNPYVSYDSSDRPFLYRGQLPAGVPPLIRVVSLGARGAWSFAYMREHRRVELDDGTVITWESGQNSALDSDEIATGRDVGNIVVQKQENGEWRDVVHGIDFAFAFHAFYPDAPIRHR